ncbi:MAG: hypothetical protein QM776_03165 [Rhodocyclaceae bacterium]
MTRLLLLLLLPCLTACENTGASYMIDGNKDHSISVVREQRYFWGSAVAQKVVAARFPICQQRYEIADGKAGAGELELYEVNEVLYVLHQGSNWWGVGTEKCELQAFKTPPEKYGDLLGKFRFDNGTFTFVAAKPATAPGK